VDARGKTKRGRQGGEEREGKKGRGRQGGGDRERPTDLENVEWEERSFGDCLVERNSIV
jgi:hypothetical protein